MASMQDLFDSAVEDEYCSVSMTIRASVDYTAPFGNPIGYRSDAFVEIHVVTTATVQWEPAARMLRSVLRDMVDRYEVWEFRRPRGKVR